MSGRRWGWLLGVGIVSACADGGVEDDTDPADGADDTEETDTPEETDDAVETDDADTDVVDETDVADTDASEDTAWDTGIVALDGGDDTALPVDTDPLTPCTTDETFTVSVEVDGRCYAGVNELTSWADARSKCESVGGRLADVPDRETALQLRRLGLGELWLGGSDADAEGRWTWTTGAVVPADNWDQNEPNNLNEQNCLKQYRTAEWDDDDCGNVYRYVCVFDACTDGILDAGEACDDGNADNGDGCDADCTFTDCGNGVRTSGEACDDGNTVGGDGCEADCTLPCGTAAGAVAAWQHGSVCRFVLPTTQDGEAAAAECEDLDAALVHPRDAADVGRVSAMATAPWIGLYDEGFGVYAWRDGETSPFSAWAGGVPVGTVDTRCVGLEDGARWWSADDCARARAVICEVTTPTCGDGVLDAGEACDDGNRETEACPYGVGPCTVCDASCAEVDGRVTSCGDGVVDAGNGETCDDGVYPSALCTACVADAGAVCVGQPNQCFGEVYEATSLGLTIPDGDYDGSVGSMACADVDVQPAVDRAVGRVAVQVAVDHTWIGDLTVKLVSPTGSVVTLMSQPGWAEVGDDGGYAGWTETEGGESADLSDAGPVTFADGLDPRAEALGGGLPDVGVACVDDDVCAVSPWSGAAEDARLASLAAELRRGVWKVCVGDAAQPDEGEVDDVRVMFR